MRRDLSISHRTKLKQKTSPLNVGEVVDANGLRDTMTITYSADEKPQWNRYISGGEIE